MKSALNAIESKELIWLVKALGELATPEAKELLKGILSVSSEETDPLIYALLVAKEDLQVILKFYANFSISKLWKSCTPSYQFAAPGYL